VLAKEERQLTLKNMRGRNHSRAQWIDFASRLTSTGGKIRFDGTGTRAGFRFVPPIDDGTSPEYRQSADWRALTFVFAGTTHTVVCFNHPDNPKPRVEDSAPYRLGGGSAETVSTLGYGFTSDVDERTPLLVHYRMWIQEGRMPTEELQALSHDFLQPIHVEAK